MQPNEGMVHAPKPKRQFPFGLVFVVLLLLAAVGGGVWWYLQQKTDSPQRTAGSAQSNKPTARGAGTANQAEITSRPLGLDKVITTSVRLVPGSRVIAIPASTDLDANISQTFGVVQRNDIVANFIFTSQPEANVFPVVGRASLTSYGSAEVNRLTLTDKSFWLRQNDSPQSANARTTAEKRAYLNELRNTKDLKKCSNDRTYIATKDGRFTGCAEIVPDSQPGRYAPEVSIEMVGTIAERPMLLSVRYALHDQAETDLASASPDEINQAALNFKRELPADTKRLYDAFLSAVAATSIEAKNI